MGKKYRHVNDYGYTEYLDSLPVRDCSCDICARASRRKQSGGSSRRRGTMGSTGFRDLPQRDDPNVINSYFNSGKEDGEAHGHVKYRQNPDGTTTYFYARDVEGTEYDV